MMVANVDKILVLCFHQFRLLTPCLLASNTSCNLLEADKCGCIFLAVNTTLQIYISLPYIKLSSTKFLHSLYTQIPSLKKPLKLYLQRFVVKTHY